MNALIVVTLGLGLALDVYWKSHGQLLVSAATWLVLLALWSRSTARERPALITCLAFATAGEVFLSLGWGLYEYRLGNIPMFVPPGHVLLFFLGMSISSRLRDGAEWWIAALAAPLVIAFAWHGTDTMGPLLYALFLACMWLSPSRKLYGTMFVLSLLLEIYGTWLGNWRWAENVPWLGLTSYNPPIAAGTFYCVLDFLVVTAVVKIGDRPLFRRTRNRGQSPASVAGQAMIDSHHAATCSARSSSR